MSGVKSVFGIVALAHAAEFVKERVFRPANIACVEKFGRKVVLNDLVVDGTITAESDKLCMARALNPCSITVSIDCPSDLDPSVIFSEFLKLDKRFSDGDYIHEDVPRISLDLESVNLNVTPRHKAHRASPYVADAEADTSVDPALTVQEGTDIQSPGVGVAGACDCAAPADSSHTKKKPGVTAPGQNTNA